MTDRENPRLEGRDLEVKSHRDEVEFSDPEADDDEDATIRAKKDVVVTVGFAK